MTQGHGSLVPDATTIWSAVCQTFHHGMNSAGVPSTEDACDPTHAADHQSGKATMVMISKMKLTMKMAT